MTYKDGSWGEQAKSRSKKRLEYFKKYRLLFFKPKPKSHKLDPKRIKTKDLKNKIFEKYGEKCKRCGFSDRRALQIDHVNGNGKEERKSKTKTINNYWKFYKKVLNDLDNNYQILCANCNWIKRYENKEYKK